MGYNVITILYLVIFVKLPKSRPDGPLYSHVFMLALPIEFTNSKSWWRFPFPRHIYCLCFSCRIGRVHLCVFRMIFRKYFSFSACLSTKDITQGASLVKTSRECTVIRRPRGLAWDIICLTATICPKRQIEKKIKAIIILPLTKNCARSYQNTSSVWKNVILSNRKQWQNARHPSCYRQLERSLRAEARAFLQTNRQSKNRGCILLCPLIIFLYGKEGI